MKVAHAVRNSEMLGYGPKTSKCKVTMNRLKSMFLSQLTLLSNNLVLRLFWAVFTQNHGFLGYGEDCRKHWRKEENRQRKSIEKWREGKTKNTRRVK